MSLKNEQYRAMWWARQFLIDVVTKPRRSQKELKEAARRCLRHYPLLKQNGEPMFSNDDFPCPDIKESK